MIKIGVCSSVDTIEEVASAGYEYLETGFAALAALPEEQYQRQKQKALAAPIRVEACNSMLPASQRVTGPGVDLSAVEAFITRGFSRAQALGVEVVVFGSAGARNVPEGWPYEKAWKQIMDYLRMAEPIARSYGITIALEPLQRGESNILHYVSEGALIASVLDLPNLRTLGDIYHMVLNREPISCLTNAGTLLAHTHIANPEGRFFPSSAEEFDYKGVFRALIAADYQGRISVEGRAKDFSLDLPVAYRVLSEAREAAR